MTIHVVLVGRRLLRRRRSLLAAVSLGMISFVLSMCEGGETGAATENEGQGSTPM